MRKLLSTLFIASAITLSASADDAVKAKLHADKPGAKINREIYGQFSEHLGSCIYGGLWVGENSPIPNIKGYRKDVFEALKKLQIPVLRWPGGCFADDYHWMDGIGPKSQRPSLRNNNWGGTIEDNSFGTHEFLNLCEMLDCEPYISGNVGSGTVKEMAQWVEYMTSDGDTPMARLRRQNGREKAWHVKYFGIGNEAWGCGGNMTPEYYSDEYRKFNTYLRDQGKNKLYRIASGASDYDYDWTRVLMDKIGNRMQGVSLHYYTCSGWEGSKGSATKFNNDQYYWALGKCLEIEEVIKKHKAIMDEKDPKHEVGLLVDEWGTWWDEEPGTIAGHLYQQNALRDAFVAALSLNVFHRHTDRVKMANIAQVVNVLQSMRRPPICPSISTAKSSRSARPISKRRKAPRMQAIVPALSSQPLPPRPRTAASSFHSPMSALTKTRPSNSTSRVSMPRPSVVASSPPGRLTTSTTSSIQPKSPPSPSRMPS